jgi:hypothetical protein
MKTPIDKLRIIVNWANYQNEGFNDRFKSISDIEKAYDYCVENDIEFLDELQHYLDKEERLKIVNDLKGILDYPIF